MFAASTNTSRFILEATFHTNDNILFVCDSARTVLVPLLLSHLDFGLHQIHFTRFVPRQSDWVTTRDPRSNLTTHKNSKACLTCARARFEQTAAILVLLKALVSQAVYIGHFFYRETPIAQIGERRTLDRKSWVRSSAGAGCCVLEQDTSSPLLSLG